MVLTFDSFVSVPNCDHANTVSSQWHAKEPTNQRGNQKKRYDWRAAEQMSKQRKKTKLNYFSYPTRCNDRVFKHTLAQRAEQLWWRLLHKQNNCLKLSKRPLTWLSCFELQVKQKEFKLRLLKHDFHKTQAFCCLFLDL